MENMFVGFKKGIKGFKIWDPTDRKFLLSRDVTFDEAFMLKPKVSQQVETSKTKDVSQQVENDANPLSLESSASVRIIPRVTQGNDQAYDEVDADEEEGQEQVMGDVPDSTAVGRPRRNTRKLSWFTTDMVMLMHFRSLRRLSHPPSEKLKSVQSRRCGKQPWKKR